MDYSFFKRNSSTSEPSGLPHETYDRIMANGSFLFFIFFNCIGKKFVIKVNIFSLKVGNLSERSQPEQRQSPLPSFLVPHAVFTRMSERVGKWAYTKIAGVNFLLIN